MTTEEKILALVAHWYDVKQRQRRLHTVDIPALMQRISELKRSEGEYRHQLKGQLKSVKEDYRQLLELEADILVRLATVMELGKEIEKL